MTTSNQQMAGEALQACCCHALSEPRSLKPSGLRHYCACPLPVQPPPHSTPRLHHCTATGCMCVAEQTARASLGKVHMQSCSRAASSQTLCHWWPAASYSCPCLLQRLSAPRQQLCGKFICCCLCMRLSRSPMAVSPLPGARLCLVCAIQGPQQWGGCRGGLGVQSWRHRQ